MLHRLVFYIMVSGCNCSLRATIKMLFIGIISNISTVFKTVLVQQQGWVFAEQPPGDRTVPAGGGEVLQLPALQRG